jgi:hypothetical protein
MLGMAQLSTMRAPHQNHGTVPYLYSTVQYSTVPYLYSAVQCSTVQYSTVQYRTVPYLWPQQARQPLHRKCWAATATRIGAPVPATHVEMESDHQITWTLSVRPSPPAHRPSLKDRADQRGIPSQDARRHCRTITQPRGEE